MKTFSKTIITLLSATLLNTQAFADDPIGPPTLGESTKGTPAVAEVEPSETKPQLEQQEADPNVTKTEQTSAFGTVTVTEHKRDSGQRYLIELEHSLGGKQYIHETDSDGKIESSGSDDSEDTPNLPKWKLGSW